MELPKFAVLERMARENPEALEELRQAHIEAAINQSCEANRRRLRGLQFKIDAIRQTSSNPMSGCIRISKLMHDSLMELNTVLQADTAVHANVPPAVDSTSCRVFHIDQFRQARA